MKNLRFTLLLFACSTAFALAQRPTIITSIHPYDALVQEIVGENAEVIQMLPSGASPHTFDPTPQDVINLEC